MDLPIGPANADSPMIDWLDPTEAVAHNASVRALDGRPEIQALERDRNMATAQLWQVGWRRRCEPFGVLARVIYFVGMLRRVSLGLFLCMASTAVRAADFQPATLDRIIETTREFWNTPGLAVAIVHGDDIVYMRGFGVKHLGSSDPVTADTRFAIYSSTKSFTSAALGILVDEGKLSWDDPVRTRLPYFKLSDPLADANVTIRDLLCHRTGLGNRDWLWISSSGAYTSASREEIIRTLGLLPLSYSFRSTWEYQSSTFLAAGEVLAHVAGTTWEEFVRRRLLASLGMTNSGVSVRDALQSVDHATPHQRRGEKTEAIDWPDFGQLAAASSMNSSVRDLTRWMRLHLNEGRFEGRVILKDGTIHETHTPQMLRSTRPSTLNEGPHMAAYGLGWFIQDYRGHHVVYDPGAADGFGSQVLLLPDEHYGIAILTNLGNESVSGNINPAVAIVQDAIMDQLLGLPAKDRNAAVLAELRQAAADKEKQREQRESRRLKDTRPSHSPTEYAGTYEHPAYGKLLVRENASKLEVEFRGLRGSLEHYDFDTFRIVGLGAFKDDVAQFRLNLDGNISKLYFLGQEFYRKR